MTEHVIVTDTEGFSITVDNNAPDHIGMLRVSAVNPDEDFIAVDLTPVQAMTLANALEDAANAPVSDRPLVEWIRTVCAAELKESRDFPFFWSDYRRDETPDAAILRLFRAERRASNHGSALGVVLTLCHG